MEAITAAAPPQLPARLLRFFAKYPPQLYGAKYTGQTLPLTKKDAKLQRIAEAEQKEQRMASRVAREEEESAAEAALRSTGSADWDRIKAVNAGQMNAPKVKLALKMPSIFHPKYISLPKLERLRIAGLKDAATKRSTAADPETASTLPSMPSPPMSQSAKQKRLPRNPFLPKTRSFNQETRRFKWAAADIGLRRQAELVKIAKKHGVEALLPASRKSTEFKQQRILTRGLRVKGTGEGQKVKGHKWERQYDAKMEERFKAIQNMPALVREWEARGHGRGWKKDRYPKVKMP